MSISSFMPTELAVVFQHLAKQFYIDFSAPQHVYISTGCQQVLHEDWHECRMSISTNIPKLMLK